MSELLFHSERLHSITSAAAVWENLKPLSLSLSDIAGQSYCFFSLICSRIAIEKM